MGFCNTIIAAVNASPAERAALIRMKDSDVPAVPITRLSGKEGGILA